MMPRASHPLVHPGPAPAPAAQGQGQQAAAPVPAPAPAPMQVQGQGNANAGPNAPPGVRMRDFPGAPGTRAGLGLRLAQAVLAGVALAAMASADDFASITSFRYLVPAAALQCLWSLAVAVVDVYALLVGRRFRTAQTVGVFVVGDWITGALTFSAASASAGITTLINNDLEYCYGNPCPSFMAATAMAFLSCVALAPSCVLNLGTVVYKLQRP
ncbi:unnamed protein product [Alopecurus aequalis]